MPRCREKLAELDYEVWDGDIAKIAAFVGKRNWRVVDVEHQVLSIENHNALIRAELGDVILKDASGNLFKLKPLAYAQAYETIRG